MPIQSSVAAAPTTISFAVAGDHGANSKTAASLNKLDSSGVDFYLAIGDLDYHETPGPNYGTTWCEYVKSRLPTLGPNFPFEVLAGNHEERSIQQHAACLPDRLGSTLGPSNQYATEYFFDYPASAPLVRVLMISPALVINTVAYNYDAGSTRYNWVAGAIDDARAQRVPWVVVGMHKNCFTSAGSSSCEVGADLMNMLVQKKVDLVIQGHDHTYKRGKQLALKSSTCPTVARAYDPDCVVDDGADNQYSKGRGTIVLINGSFGKGGSSSPGGNFIRAFGGDGFSKFTVTAERIDAEFVNSTASFTDSYSIVPNQAPIVTYPGEQDHGEEQPVAVSIGATDPERDPITYGATGLPPGLTINNATGVISGTIPQGAVKTSPYTTRVTATDDLMASSSVEFNWIVRDITAPATPASLTVVRHTTGLSLDWPDNIEPDLAGYDLYRSPTDTGTYTRVNSSRLMASAYFDETAPPNATSYYKLHALDEVGNASPPRIGSARRSKIVFVSSSTAKGSGMTMVIPKPAGAETGDVLLAGLWVRGSVAVPTPPPGWSLVSQVTRTGTMNHQAIFRRTVAAGDPSSYTFTTMGRSSAVGMIGAYRRAMGGPAASGGQANPSSKSITAPSITATRPDSVLVGFFGIAGAASLSPPAGMMERGEHMLFSGLLRGTLEMADAVVNVQALGTRVATAPMPAENIGQVVVLSPAP